MGGVGTVEPDDIDEGEKLGSDLSRAREMDILILSLSCPMRSGV